MIYREWKRLSLLAFCLTIASLAALSQNSTSVKYTTTTYAGIEVGSKGVKMSIIELGKNALVTGNFNTLQDTSVNTDFISFTPQTFTATVNGFASLYKTAVNKYNINPSNIYTVVSSGVKG